MRKGLKLIGCMTIFVLLAVHVRTQDQASEDIHYTLPAMRVLNLEGVAPSLTLATPSQGGTHINDATCSTSWINYTSVVDNGSTHKVSVVLDASSVIPSGTVLKVEAATYSGNGNGTFGAPSGTIILSTTPQNLITNIGSCYTGTGTTNGHKLTYTWSVNTNDYASLVASGSSVVKVTYTITGS